MLTDEFVNDIGLIRSLSFCALYFTTTEVEPDPTPFDWVDCKLTETVSLFCNPCKVDPVDTVEIPTLAVILSTFPLTWEKFDSIEYSKLSKFPITFPFLKKTAGVFAVKASPTRSFENLRI